MKNEMDDNRLDYLREHLVTAGDGFANYIMMKPELKAALDELRKYRDRPAHCPCCDGGHT